MYLCIYRVFFPLCFLSYSVKWKEPTPLPRWIRQDCQLGLPNINYDSNKIEQFTIKMNSDKKKWQLRKYGRHIFSSCWFISVDISVYTLSFPLFHWLIFSDSHIPALTTVFPHRDSMCSQAHAVFTGRTVATGRLWTDTTWRLLFSSVAMLVSVSAKVFHY